MIMTTSLGYTQPMFVVSLFKFSQANTVNIYLNVTRYRSVYLKRVSMHVRRHMLEQRPLTLNW